VDCGIFQGEAYADQENKKKFSFKVSDIKFVILTHAHADHCGLLLRLYKEGFRGKIYCTTATGNLTILMLRNIVSNSEEIYTRQDQNLIKSLNFSYLDQRPDFGLGRYLSIDSDLSIACLRSSHILGAISIGISWTTPEAHRRYIVMSGDLGNNTRESRYQSLLSSQQKPSSRTNYIVVESTYGSRIRNEYVKNFENRIVELAKVVRETVFYHRELLLIPAFSLQRSQEILFDLYYIFTKRRDLLDEQQMGFFASSNNDYPVQIVLDSPLTHSINKVFRDELKRAQIKKPEKALYRNKIMREMFEVETEHEVENIIDDIFFGEQGDHDISGNATIRIQRNFILPNATELRRQGAIIISGAGSCEGGPIVSHLPLLLKKKNAKILLTGYMSNDTVGAKIQAIAQQRTDNSVLNFKSFDVNGETIRVDEVKADLHLMGDFYSGHPDQAGILDFIFKLRLPSNGGLQPTVVPEMVPTTVFLTHGSEPARKALKEAIEARIIDGAERKIEKVELPLKDLRWYDLDKGSWDEKVSSETRSQTIEFLIAEQKKTHALLNQLLQRLDKIFPNSPEGSE
jgi:metallo-beta-lactamase family protein